jgi:hypothetical protein
LILFPRINLMIAAIQSVPIAVPIAISCWLTLPVGALADTEAPKPFDFARAMRQIESLQESGQLRQADAMVGGLIEKHADRLTPAEREQLDYELERSGRIRKDYSLSEEALV